jgi:hypothetical protein
MTSIPAFIRNRFRPVGLGAVAPKLGNGPGVAVLLEGDAGDGKPTRVIEVVAAGGDIFAVAADLVAGHLKGHPQASVHARAALIPDLAERERSVRELVALCRKGTGPRSS